MIREHKASDGSPVLEFVSAEGAFFLSSRVAPVQEAARILDGEFEEDVEMVIVFGAGHIPLIQKAVELFRSAKVAVVEKEAVILDAAKPLLENTAKPVTWLSGESLFKDLEVLLLEHPSRRIKFIHNRTEIRLAPDFYQKIKNEIIRLHDKKSINSNTLQRFERIWLRNVTGNTEAIIRAGGIADLRGMGKGLQALMIAAGPSLGKQLELIRTSQGKAVLVAADTVYKTLLNNGIRPDLVVVVDPQKINSRSVENIPESALRETIFVAEPAVIPKALEGSPGRLVMFNTIFPYYAHIAAHFGEKGNVDMGGSVATTAFDVCAQLGFDRTLVVGLDLSFKEDAYHVPGTMYEEHWFSGVRRFKTFEMQTFRLLDYFNLTPVKDQLGDTVYMDSRFVLFRSWFEKRLEETPIQNAFRNGTAGGIPLKNLERQDLGEFLSHSVTDAAKKKALQDAIRDSIQKRASVPSEKIRGFGE
ncbi:MAG: motility associated factor glycosyltransferase family protein, partial [Spirochaetia bacterium]|nr:motility associated factor glycosyltransferase family protein [Spirochaetia bacterium]